MFKTELNAGMLKRIMQTLGETISEARMKISKDGISVSAVDPANVLMTKMEIPLGVFEVYEVDPVTIGLDVIKIVNMLSDVNDSGNAILELSEDNARINMKVGNMEWSTSLMAAESTRPEPRIPDITLPAKVCIDGARFSKIVKSAMNMSDHIILGVKDSVFFASAGDGIQSFEAKIPLSELPGSVAGEARSLFSLDYVEDMAKAARKSDVVNIELGTDFPMRMSFRVGNNLDPGALPSVSYLLAPRFERD